MHKVSVVILNWNGIGFLKEFIPILVQHTSLLGVELVVADNNSSDESVVYLKTNHPTVRIIQFNQNHGFAGGYNNALKQIDSEYLVLLNSDVEVTANWLMPVIEFLDAHPEAAAAMPKILSYHNRTQFEYAGAAGGFIDKYGYPFCRGRVFDDLETDNGQYNDIVPVFWVTGACMVIKAKAYFEAGGLDEAFFAHMEEIDLCWRLHWRGYKLYCVPTATVYHVGGGALPKENPKKIYLNFRNNLFLLYKNLPQKVLYRKLFVRMCLDFIAAVQFLFKLKFNFFYAVFEAHMHFYKKMSYFRTYRGTAISLLSKDEHLPEVLGKSIVIQYFIKGNKTFKTIVEK
jgi:GT2 family glycosyltransferase